MADKPDPSTTLPPTFSTLRQLYEGGLTGILRLRAEGWTDVDLYFMDGTLISAAALSDDWLLARLLCRGGALKREMLVPLIDTMEAMPLPDVLLQQQQVPVEVVQAAQGECFQENVAMACATPWHSADFCPEDVVFPPNMQLGVDTGVLIDEMASWFEHVEPLLAVVNRPFDPVLQATDEPPPKREPHATIAAQCQEPVRYSEVLALSPWMPFRSQLALAHLISSQAITIEVEPAGGGAPLSMTGELRAIAEATLAEESGDSLSTAHIEPLTASFDGESPFGEGERDGVATDGGIDYDHVDAGGHAHVYDVLDKVDLSHVDAFPGHDELIETAADDDELVIAAAEESIEIGGAEIFGEESASDDDEMFIEIESADSESNFDSVSHSDAPPIHLSGTEEAFELSIDDEDDPAPAPHRAPEVHGEIPDELPTGLGFPPDEIRSFDRRIQVFNQIFRVIYETFRGVLGDEAVHQRFDRFLEDESLQYPNLFSGLTTNRDGTLGPAPLIRNLATEDPADADSFLHQGLYELIYVHLYDAKDVLSPEDEQTMMDQIAAHEELLHQ